MDVYEWKDFTILYEDDDSLVRVNRLLEKYDPKGYTVTVRQLPDEDMKCVPALSPHECLINSNLSFRL